jgi:hypothetical protein
LETNDEHQARTLQNALHYNVITKFSWLEKQMTNNNMWDCAERSFSIDDSSDFNLFLFFVFLVCKLYL